MSNNLLCPQRYAGRLLGWQGQRFVIGVCMEDLGPTERSGHGLQRNSGDVDLRLLGS